MNRITAIQQIETLDETQSRNLLDHVVNQSGLDDSTEISQEALMAILKELQATEPDEPALADPSKQALVLIANDPLLRPALTESAPGPNIKPKQFFIDPISILSASALAMVVLNSYLHIKKDKEGWTFEFKVKPSSDGIKKELLKLVKSLCHLS